MPRQAATDLSGVPVLASPVEATALGNVLVQARAIGAFRTPRSQACGRWWSSFPRGDRSRISQTPCRSVGADT